ncbi:hypothetical protein B0H67DRAFT_688114 [Lasiosphaeris hirsuta]|uniref:Uncharacterized protein n=1 Tax=Lasiosphaeris hirsuta TaxID=260670 RepID=A0AA40DHP4_9PEZI|nr:hypothetical protein B0H67DRAFT_688114 [Lasiosphaeris hirsuta]
MSGSDGSRPILAPRMPASVTVQLYSNVVGQEELEVCRTGDHSLKITKKSYQDGTKTHTERLDLTKNAVLPLYADADNTDLERLWQIDVVYGTGSDRETVEYQFREQQDAFTFQRLVTGYSPIRSLRFEKVSASALEQHTLRRATEIDVKGEAQLWQWSDPQGELSPLSTTPTGSCTRGGTGSIRSTARIVRGGGTVQKDLKGREIIVTMAKPPPLLVILARKAATKQESKKPDRGAYQMMRVNVTDLEYRPSGNDPTKLELIDWEEGSFYVDVLAVQNVDAWNICHLRPAIYSRYFRRHTCTVLTLGFDNFQSVELFKNELVNLQAAALNIRPLSQQHPRRGSNAPATQSYPASSSASTMERVPDGTATRSRAPPAQGDEATPTETTELQDNSASSTMPVQQIWHQGQGKGTNFESIIVSGGGESAAGTDICEGAPRSGGHGAFKHEALRRGEIRFMSDIFRRAERVAA